VAGKDSGVITRSPLNVASALSGRIKFMCQKHQQEDEAVSGVVKILCGVVLLVAASFIVYLIHWLATQP